MSIARRRDADRSNEIRTTGASAKRHLLDWKVRLRREDVREESANLDRGSVSVDSDAFRRLRRTVTTNRMFEWFCGVGTREDLLQLGQTTSPDRVSVKTVERAKGNMA